MGLIPGLITLALGLAAEPPPPAVYPPARHWDHVHMRLDLDIPSMDAPRMSGVETLTLTPIGRARDRIVLNAVELVVSAVEVAASPVPFTQEDGQLRIDLPRPVPPGTTIEAVIRYDVDYPNARGIGLTWTPGRPARPGPTDQAPQIHSQGQPEDNRRWFPCHDFPNERLTTELVVTVEDGFQVCSNGRLVGSRRAGPGRTTWHWLQDKPHPAYLVLLVVGRFSIVGLTPDEQTITPRPDGARPVPLMVYTPVGTEENARRAFANTPEMVAYFERLLDEPYPWDKYAQVLVRNFAAGGMENTSATTLQPGTAGSRRGGADSLISHELAHQWFGDLVGYKSWEHVWLGEGWASYAEALWSGHRAESRDDAEAGERAYQRVIARFLAGQRGMNRTFAPDFGGMVSKRYTNPDHRFFNPNDVYGKGAIVLHMLRLRLGDEAFWAGVRLYIDRHKLQSVETDDFRRALEDASGENLERFFDQWCRRPGLPRLGIAIEWTGDPGGSGRGTLGVAIDQTQRIDADNPAYALTLPVLVTYADESTESFVIEMETARTVASFALREKPKDVVVNPDLTSAAPATITKPLAMWLHQLEAGPTVFARCEAAEHLAAQPGPEAARTLVRLALDPTGDVAVRRVATLALAARVVCSAGELSADPMRFGARRWPANSGLALAARTLSSHP